MRWSDGVATYTRAPPTGTGSPVPVASSSVPPIATSVSVPMSASAVVTGGPSTRAGSTTGTVTTSHSDGFQRASVPIADQKCDTCAKPSGRATLTGSGSSSGSVLIAHGGPPGAPAAPATSGPCASSTAPPSYTSPRPRSAPPPAPSPPL